MLALTSLYIACESLSELGAGLGVKLRGLSELKKADVEADRDSRLSRRQLHAQCFPPGCTVFTRDWAGAACGLFDEYVSDSLDDSDEVDSDSDPSW